LGYPHPDILLSILTSKQLSEWMAFASLEPIASDREDMRSALLMAQLERLHTGKSTSAEKYLKLFNTVPPRTQTPEEQWVALQGVLRRGNSSGPERRGQI
jgi:hypothetical protein